MSDSRQTDDDRGWHDRAEELYQASGKIKDSRPLVSFLHDLIRDHLAFGVVEELLQDAIDFVESDDHLYANGFLAQYAQNVADRLGVRLGVTGEERDNRFEAIDRIWRTAVELTGLKQFNHDFPTTEQLETLAAYLEQVTWTLKHQETQKRRVRATEIIAGPGAVTSWVASCIPHYELGGDISSLYAMPFEGPLSDTPDEALGALVRVLPNVFDVRFDVQKLEERSDWESLRQKHPEHAAAVAAGRDMRTPKSVISVEYHNELCNSGYVASVVVPEKHSSVTETFKGDIRATREEAIGSLVMAHPELFGVTV